MEFESQVAEWMNTVEWRVPIGYRWPVFRQVPLGEESAVVIPDSVWDAEVTFEKAALATINLRRTLRDAITRANHFLSLWLNVTGSLPERKKPLRCGWCGDELDLSTAWNEHGRLFCDTWCISMWQDNHD